MSVSVHCACGNRWQEPPNREGQKAFCRVCGQAVTVGEPSEAASPYTAPVHAGGAPAGFFGARGGPPPSRSMATTGGILGLLAGLGHASIGALLLLLAAILAAFIQALVGGLPGGDQVTAEAYGILVALFAYTLLNTVSCVIAIMAIVGRYWAVLATAIFQGLMTALLAVLTVTSGEVLVGLAAAFSGGAALCCVLGVPQARAYRQWQRGAG